MIVHYKKANLLIFGQSSDPNYIRLKPGANDVDPAKWENAMKCYPHLKHLIDNDELEVVNDAKGNPLEGPDLSAMTEKLAVRLIKQTADEELLLRWIETETRKPVVKAIENQMAALAQAGEPEKGKA